MMRAKTEKMVKRWGEQRWALAVEERQVPDKWTWSTVLNGAAMGGGA